jgi:hypothetical protein
MLELRRFAEEKGKLYEFKSWCLSHGQGDEIETSPKVVDGKATDQLEQWPAKKPTKFAPADLLKQALEGFRAKFMGEDPVAKMLYFTEKGVDLYLRAEAKPSIQKPVDAEGGLNKILAGLIKQGICQNMDEAKAHLAKVLGVA